MVAIPSFLSKTMKYFPSVIVPAISNSVAIIVFSRLLPPSEMGLYFLVIAGSSVGSILLGNWYQQAILRYEPGLDELQLEASSRAHIGFFTISLGVAALLGAGEVLLGHNFMWSRAIGLVVVLMSVLDAWYRCLLSMLQARDKPKLYSWIASGFGVIRYGIALAVYFAGDQSFRALLTGAITGQLLAIVVISSHLGLFRIFVAMLASRRNVLHQSLLLLVRNAKYGAPMMVFMILSEGRPLFERAIIGWAMGEHFVGLYGSNSAIGVNLTGLIALPMLLTAHPILMGFVNAEKPDWNLFLASNFLIMKMFLLLSTVLLVVVIPNSRVIAALLVGSAYVDGHPIVSIMVLSSTIGGLAIYVGKGLEALQKPNYMLGSNALAFAVGGIVTVLLLPSYGIIAAGLGACVYSLTLLVSQFILLKRFLSIRIPVRLAAISAGIVLLLAILVSPSLVYENALFGIVASLFSVAVYFATSVWAGELSRRSVTRAFETIYASLSNR